jgi:hypothetical protein
MFGKCVNGDGIYEKFSTGVQCSTCGDLYAETGTCKRCRRFGYVAIGECLGGCGSAASQIRTHLVEEGPLHVTSPVPPEEGR